MSRSLCVLLVAVTACDAQVDGDHNGDVLATVQGTLHSARMQTLPDPEVAVVWAARSKMGGVVGAEPVAAEGLFPHFQIAIYSPPPADWTDEFDGDEYGIGFVVVGTSETDFTSRSQWYGVDLARVVVYLPKATQPGSTIEGFLHGPAAAGFHIYSVKRLTEVERQERLACVNMIPHPGRMLDSHDIFTNCRGAGNDELDPTPADLETVLDIEIVEDTDIVDLINSLPRW